MADIEPDLDIEVPCPVSGLRLNGRLIIGHMLKTHMCKSKRALTAYCRTHASRVFICEPELLRELMENSNGFAKTSAESNTGRRKPRA